MPARRPSPAPFAPHVFRTSFSNWQTSYPSPGTNIQVKVDAPAVIRLTAKTRSRVLRSRHAKRRNDVPALSDERLIPARLRLSRYFDLAPAHPPPTLGRFDARRRHLPVGGIGRFDGIGNSLSPQD